MIKEIHVLLDRYYMADQDVFVSYASTYHAIEAGGYDVIYTVQPHFLSWRYAERLFVHYNGEIHEIKLGVHESNGTKRQIREGHSIEKLLMNGEFDWFAED